LPSKPSPRYIKAMPALKNARQERFCQLVKQGLPPYRAYPMAGYRPHNGEPYRLRENPRVKRRLAELTRSLAMKTKVSVESLTDELDAVTKGAVAAEQYGAARGAIETKAKLHGLLVERKESGAPGDFASLGTVDEIVAKVRSELGEQAALLLQGALDKPEQDSTPEADIPAPSSDVLN